MKRCEKRGGLPHAGKFAMEMSTTVAIQLRVVGHNWKAGLLT